MTSFIYSIFKNTKKPSICLLLLHLKAFASTCPPEFINDYHKMRDAFGDVYHPDATVKELEHFKSSLYDFLKDHHGKVCRFKGIVFDPTQSVEELLYEISTIPLVYSDRGVFETDDRIQAKKSDVAIWMESVAAMIHVRDIKPNGTFIKRSLNLCPEEQFSNEKSTALCSGFLIDRDLLLTAGHCVGRDLSCPRNRWVFGLYKETQTLGPLNIYKCAEVISTTSRNESHDQKPTRDYALIRLDRPVVGRRPLLLAGGEKIPDTADLVMLGYPSGLPAKITENGKILDNSHPDYFLSDLDAFTGNSGGPVIDKKTGLVEGIVFFGSIDYQKDESRDCSKARICQKNECATRVARISVVKGIPPHLYSLSKENVWQGIFFRKKLPQISLVQEGGLIPFYGLQKNGLVLAGRSFLHMCGLHIFKKDDLSWRKFFVGSCSNSELERVYNFYLTQVRSTSLSPF